MQTENNSHGKSEEELREQQKNKAASENMDANGELENSKYQENQNKLTQSENPEEDDSSLLNNNPGHQSTDSFSIEEQNRRRLNKEQDEDFGSEQIKQ